MCRARPNLESQGDDVNEREHEEDTTSESPSDNFSSSAALIAGIALVGAFFVPQVKNLVQSRRRRRPRIEALSVPLCKDKYDLKDEISVEEYCFSMSDVESYADDKEEQVPLPSPRFVVPKKSIHGLHYGVGDEVDDTLSTTTDDRKEHDAATFEQVKNLIYRRKFVDSKIHLTPLSSDLPGTGAKHCHGIGSILYDDDLKNGKRNSQFLSCSQQNSVSVHCASRSFPGKDSVLNSLLNIVKDIGSSRTLK